MIDRSIDHLRVLHLLVGGSALARRRRPSGSLARSRRPTGIVVVVVVVIVIIELLLGPLLRRVDEVLRHELEAPARRCGDPGHLEGEGLVLGFVVHGVDHLGHLVERVAAGQRREVELLDLGFRRLPALAQGAAKVPQALAVGLDDVELVRGRDVVVARDRDGRAERTERTVDREVVHVIREPPRDDARRHGRPVVDVARRFLRTEKRRHLHVRYRRRAS
mmetsp:Transcript_18471/g.73776  ORF Transcript_18471/g.73776 Transcript_18471/m.73776 type:complete len:220 (-) Transcript_18471:378-1037(-)